MTPTAASAAHELDTYWSAVVTTVPVLALAAVLEVRRVASRWSARDRTRRLTDALSFGGYVLALCFSFSVGLAALAYGGFGSFIGIVNTAMTGAVGLVILAPIMSVVVGGNADVGTILSRYLPFSRAARLRRKASRGERLVRRVLLNSLEQLEETELLVTTTRRLARHGQEAVEEAQANVLLAERMPARPERAQVVASGEALLRLAEQNHADLSKMEAKANALLENAWESFMRVEYNHTSLLRVKHILAPWHITQKSMDRLDKTIAALSREGGGR